MQTPANPKIYHIVHRDRLPSIVADGRLWCDEEMRRRAEDGAAGMGTEIGMDSIKTRRLHARLASHRGLYVSQCVPFYFCPRSVMLYVISCENHPELKYRGGQEPVIHLEADLRESVAWADGNRRRWAFTLANAGSGYFQDRADLAQLDALDWDAITTRYWQDCKEEKQAEFLVERSFPWTLVRRIGVSSKNTRAQVGTALQNAAHRPHLEVKPEWYY